ncbi:hypothetical protein P3T73_03125 [Kiritimatiellota bacterium B12222]|nr:hypothetical protein P3T73_03125 [Kiritimatiellota bacterium B12222]
MTQHTLTISVFITALLLIAGCGKEPDPIESKYPQSSMANEYTELIAEYDHQLDELAKGSRRVSSHMLQQWGQARTDYINASQAVMEATPETIDEAAEEFDRAEAQLHSTYQSIRAKL